MLAGITAILDKLSKIENESRTLCLKHAQFIASFLTDNGLDTILQVLRDYETNDIILECTRNLRTYQLTLSGPLSVFPNVCEQLTKQFQDRLNEHKEIEQKLMEEYENSQKEMETTLAQLDVYHENLRRLNVLLKSTPKRSIPVSPIENKDDFWDDSYDELQAIDFKKLQIVGSDEEDHDPFSSDFPTIENPMPSVTLHFDSIPLEPYRSANSPSAPPEQSREVSPRLATS